jgi:hypothetical protein
LFKESLSFSAAFNGFETFKSQSIKAYNFYGNSNRFTPMLHGEMKFITQKFIKLSLLGLVSMYVSKGFC